MNKVGIVILAAGGSSRLGQPKQLLEFRGKTLLQHVIDEALATKAASVVVVIGANHELIAEKTILDGTAVTVNEHWQSGMASSIHAGIGALVNDWRIESALLTLCDQPYLDRKLIKSLVRKQQESGKPIVASAYGGIVGVPAVFSREMFPALLSLQGHEGARKLITSNLKNLETLAFPNGIIDIDTPADYHYLQNEKKPESGEV